MQTLKGRVGYNPLFVGTINKYGSPPVRTKRSSLIAALNSPSWRTKLLLLVVLAAQFLVYYYFWGKRETTGGDTPTIPVATPTPSQIKIRMDLKRITKMTYIFSINPGRSGSQFLTTVLRAGGVHALHEPEPRMNGYYLQSMLHFPPHETFRERLTVKANALMQARFNVSNISNYDIHPFVYAETSNMFIKTWSDIIDFFDGFDKVNLLLYKIVILRRWLPAVVKSQYELGWFSPTHAQRGVWYYGLNDILPPLRRLEPLYPDAELSRIQQIIGYNLDIELLTNQFISKYNNHPRVKIVQVTLEALSSSVDTINGLYRELDIFRPVNHIPPAVNQREKGKKFNITTEEVIDEIEKVLYEYEKRNIRLPAVLMNQEEANQWKIVQ